MFLPYRWTFLIYYHWIYFFRVFNGLLLCVENLDRGPDSSIMWPSLHLHQPTSVIYKIIITYLLHGNTFINYCLIPFRIKTFLDIFSSSLVLSTELEERKELVWHLTDLVTLKDMQHVTDLWSHTTGWPLHLETQLQVEHTMTFWKYIGCLEFCLHYWVCL